MAPPLRIGIWALVHGNRAALEDPEEPYDASWDRNRKLILEAEAPIGAYALLEAAAEAGNVQGDDVHVAFGHDHRLVLA